MTGMDEQLDPQDRALDRLLDLVEDVEPSPGFRRRVMVALRDERGRDLGRRWRWRAAAAIAASLVLILSGWALFSGETRAPDPSPSDLAAADAVAETLDGLSDLDLLALDVEELDSIHDDWFGG